MRYLVNAMPAFTSKQIEQWRRYEEIRLSGVCNMVELPAHFPDEFSEDDAHFIITNYKGLKAEAGKQKGDEQTRKRPRAPVPTPQVLQDMGEWFEEQMTQGLDPENLGASPELLSFINECIDYAGTESQYEPCRRRRAVAE